MLMFQSARLRLTLWYVVVVGLVSLAFSWVIYESVDSELQRSFAAAEQRLRPQSMLLPKGRLLAYLADDLERAEREVLWKLVIINGVVLAVAAGSGYFLASKTLRPIELAMEQQKRFVSDASHELRTPLTSLRTEIEVALRAKQIKAKDAKELMKSNLEEVAKMQYLTEYLLALTRYENTERKIDFNQVSLEGVIESAVKKLQPKIKENKIKISKDLSEGLVWGNTASLEELFVILLDNAIKYSEKRSTIYVSTEGERGRIVAKIRDEGVGIAPSDIDKIFNRFFRADSSRTKQQSDGYGLGLSIAKSIVQLHKAEIRVSSTLGAGSTFSVCFPTHFSVNFKN